MLTRAAVVGQPVEHSLSPALHNAAYEALGLHDWRYERREVAAGSLRAFVEELGPEWVGLSVTMPLKREALTLTDTATDRARVIGAANTLIRRRGAGRASPSVVDSWEADNTDALGIVDALAEVGMAAPRAPVILGAGGTAQAAVWAFGHLGVERIRVAVRDVSRIGDIRETARRVGVALDVCTFEEIPRIFERLARASEPDVVLSTLPASAAYPASVRFLWGYSPVDPTKIRHSRKEREVWEAERGKVLFDVVYDPWPTEIARHAKDAGWRVVSGLDLLLHQATHQVEAMTGQSAPIDAMRAALQEAVVQREAR